MPCWPVSYSDGMYQVTDRDGALYPITMAGAPVTHLQAGWHPVGLQTGLPLFHLLELRNDSDGGRDGVWYLTEDLAFITHTAANLGEELSAQAVAQLTPLLRDIYDQSICAEHPRVPESSHCFAGINLHAIRELVGLVVDKALSPPDMVMADRLEAVSERYAMAGMTLSASLIRHSLDIAPAESAGGRLMLASPFDAGLLEAQDWFTPGGGLLAQVHRYRDPGPAATLYLLIGDQRRPALYIPAMNAIFATNDLYSGAQVMTTLISHYATQADPTVPEPAVDHPAPDHPPPAPHWWKRMFGLGHA